MSKIEARDKKQWAHGLLPYDAQYELQRAARTPVTDADPLARSRAIDQTLRKIRAKYPEYFQPRGHIHED